MEYCNKCGNKLTEKECVNCGISEGMVAYCENCNEFKFSMYNVAVSAVICNPDFSKILLIQQYGRPKNILVAGYVNKGENLYTIYSNDEEKTKIAQKFCDEAFSINESKPSHVNLVYAVIGTNDEDDDV